MKLYPQNIEDKIGFNTIKELLEQRCLGDLGRSYVVSLQPQSDLEKIDKLGRQTAEFKAILTSGESFPANNYLDVSDCLKKAKVDGSYLDEEEFYELKLSLTTIFKCLDFLKKREVDYPLLADACGVVNLDKSILKAIEEIIDDRGQVRDNASADLKSIRGEMISNQSKARRTLDVLLKKAKTDGFCPDDVTLTVRNGRLVIPVMAEHKRRIKGFIHDESSTGSTVFLEPTEVLEINNEIRELEYKERREIIKILRKLTGTVRENITALELAYRFLGMMDFIRAKAKLAIDLDAIWPDINPKPIIKWQRAIHPLLFLSHQRQKRKVVPLNIVLEEENRILLISGPNAGGKSVCLKSVALLQYMFQSGLLVPVMEGSVFGIFSNIFIDIGDEQSIENDLSTYSSHLTNMKFFLDNTNGKSLLLIDEFGTGTEPQFGGAIAEAILHHLNQRNSYGVITTHYANLKKLAEKSAGLINGAMRFDPDGLEPLYQLEIGKPGSSFALEIAGKIGLPQHLLNQARNLVGHSHVKFDQLITELEAEKTRLQNELLDYAIKNATLEKNAKEYRELKEKLDSEKNALLKRAKEEAKLIVSGANKIVESTIREIKENQAEKVATQKARETLKIFEKELTPEPTTVAKIKWEVIKGEIGIGDHVRVKGQDAVGEISNIKGNNAEVIMGDIKLTLKLNNLDRISSSERRETERRVKSVKGINFNEKVANFSENLDLRGKRAEEALGEVDQFIDQAVLLGKREVRIVHGKGHGILRDLIRNYLRSNPRIESAKDEHIERGGNGVSIISLR
jgi:DNA mismatch repair protein MutS2